MNWFSLTIIALGLIIGYSINRGRTANPAQPANPVKTQETDEGNREKPWRSDNLDELIDASRIPVDPIRRHRLLTEIIEKTYKQRADVRMKKIFKRFAHVHLKELPELAPVLKSEHGGSLPDIPTFKLSAMEFEEEENYPAAMAVCKMALDYGIEDGTKWGFSGRMKRLQKKQRVKRPKYYKPS